MPVRFAYIYRDGSNYKACGEVIFAGDYSEAELYALTERMQSAFDDRDYFVASQVAVRPVFLWDSGGYPASEDDHGWHEFSCLESTDQAPTDSCGRSFERFVGEVEEVLGEWEAPEPPSANTDDDD